MRKNRLPWTALATTIALAATSASGASVTKKPFGTTGDGKAVDQYTLTNDSGAYVQIIDYGGIVTRVMVPDKAGKLGDVALGFDNLGQYEKQSPYFGAIVGRVANRIAKGTFEVDGTKYQVPVNNGKNSLHGGLKGYDKRMWEAKEITSADGPSLQLSLVDPDGSEGYPGTVHVTVTYTWTTGDVLRVEYKATTDRPTPINLTNHSYWNLKDAGRSPVADHVMRSYADRYTPVDAELIPTGKVDSTDGTPMDFRTPKAIGRDIAATGGDPFGYDHNLVLPDHDGSKLVEAVALWEPTTGRSLQVWTTEPALQFYSGNFLDGSIKGRDGVTYQRRSAVAFEAQHYPDSVNHPGFPSTIVRPGQTYTQTTEFRFAASPTVPF